MKLFSRCVAGGALVVLAAMAVVTLGGCKGEPEEALVCHVGGTMRPVMEKLAKMYEDETGQEVVINSAGSGELLARIQEKKDGDVYVCHDPFLAILMRRDLGIDGWTLAHLTPVIVTRKDDTRITDLEGALKKDVKLVLTDFDKSTLGWLLPTILEKAGLIEDRKDMPKIRDKLPMLKTVRKGSQAANDVQLGSSDAAIVWDAVWYLRRSKLRKVDIIDKYLPTPDEDAVTTATKKKGKYYLMPVRVTVATLKCSDQPKAAKKFAEWLASKKATDVIRSYGFTMPAKTIKEYADGAKVAP